MFVGLAAAETVSKCRPPPLSAELPVKSVAVETIEPRTSARAPPSVARLFENEHVVRSIAEASAKIAPPLPLDAVLFVNWQLVNEAVAKFSFSAEPWPRGEVLCRNLYDVKPTLAIKSTATAP